MKKILYSLRVTKKNGSVSLVRTRKKRRISLIIQAIKNSELSECWLRVAYESIIDNFGKKVIPVNEGCYKNKKELKQAWQGFTEK